MRDVNDAAGRCIARLYQFSDYLFSTGAQKQFGLAPRVGRQQLKEIMTGTVEDMEAAVEPIGSARDFLETLNWTYSPASGHLKSVNCAHAAAVVECDRILSCLLLATPGGGMLLADNEADALVAMVEQFSLDHPDTLDAVVEILRSRFARDDIDHLVAQVRKEYLMALKAIPSASPVRPTTPPAVDGAPFIFRDDGGAWNLRFTRDGTVESAILAKTHKGLGVIHSLMCHPRRKRAAIEIVGGYESQEEAEIERRDVKSRFNEVNNLRRQARKFAAKLHDAPNEALRSVARMHHAQSLADLRNSTNFLGKPKVDTQSRAEKARQAIKNQIMRAKRAIREAGMPGLASFLDVAVKQEFQSFYFEPGINGPKFVTT